VITVRSRSSKQKTIRCVALILALSLLPACAARKAFKSGEKASQRQNYDAAILSFSKAMALDPSNARYSVALARAKVNSSHDHFQRGKRLLGAEQLEEAIAEFQQVLLLDPGHQYASNELRKAVEAMKRRDALPSEIEQIKERARQRDLGPPKLDAKTNIPILLNFAEVKLGKIFEAIGKAAGINFIFDDKTDLEKPMTIDIGNVTLEQALDILMLQTKNFYKVIDEYTLLVAPETRQKRQEYDDQVIRTFFLSNGDTKQVVTLLRSLLQARQIAENADLNSITIKDSPDKVAIADRIISANDKSKGECLIDVELLEINRALARTVGIDLSSKALSLTFRGGGQSVPLNDLNSLNQAGNWTIGVVPTVVLNFLRTDGDTRVIAKPQLRVSEGEQAEILIGDRVPIPTTSFNTSQTVGGNIVPLTSFTYQNVGITLQIEPRVHHNKEITLKVQVEISQLGAPVETTGGGQQPTIGTRQVQTVIRLRDGETNMLAGLIGSEDQVSHSGVAGLSDIPGLRKIFGNSTKTKRETDIIMTITPRIIRVPDITEDDLTALWVGTEENMRLRGPARNALNQSPFAPPDDGSAAGEGDSGTLPSVPVRRGGSLNRITPNEAVQQEDAQREASENAGAPPAAQGNQGVGGAPPPVQPPSDPPPSDPPEVDEPSDAPSGPAVVRLVPSRPRYSVGETVVVDVFMENANDVGSVPFHLRYNSQVLQFIPPAEEGGLMRSDGANTVFLAPDTGGGGEIVVGLSRLGGGDGASGTGVLCRFQFIAVAQGDAGFAFTGASVKDPQARDLPAAFSVVSVRVDP
jgi:general secretion pathway protein D